MVTSLKERMSLEALTQGLLKASARLTTRTLITILVALPTLTGRGGCLYVLKPSIQTYRDVTRLNSGERLDAEAPGAGARRIVRSGASDEEQL